MNISRCLATAVCFFVAGLSARANLYAVHLSTITYSLNGRGELVFHPGNARQFVDEAAQTESLNANTLVLVYDTDNTALEVVRKADGSIITTVMTFTGGLNVDNQRKTHNYRQNFITLSGTDAVGGSIEGPEHITYDHKANVIGYKWDGHFQYNIPGDVNTPGRVVVGKFTLGHEVRIKNTP